MTVGAPWFVLPIHSVRPADIKLPKSAPLSARYLSEALCNLAPVIRADVLAGRANSRRVRLALAQLASSRAVAVELSRSELSRAAAFLVREYGRGEKTL